MRLTVFEHFVELHVDCFAMASKISLILAAVKKSTFPNQMTSMLTMRTQWRIRQRISCAREKPSPIIVGSVIRLAEKYRYLRVQMIRTNISGRASILASAVSQY